MHLGQLVAYTVRNVRSCVSYEWVRVCARSERAGRTGRETIEERGEEDRHVGERREDGSVPRKRWWGIEVAGTRGAGRTC